jgi:F0F1-type ATP synthase membrane subunit b/b'
LRKSKDAVKAIVAAASLILAMTARATPLRVLIEEQRAKIEPAVKKFQQECSGHTDSQACKEERDALVKALDDFLRLVQNGVKVIDAHAGDASNADYQKKIEALRERAQQHLQWAQEQRMALDQ